MRTFELIDTDNDEKLTKAQLIAALGKMGIDGLLSKDEDAIFRPLTLDDRDRIEYKEFMSKLQKCGYVELSAGQKKAFRLLRKYL